MMQSTLLQQGLELMYFGMGTVFVFLAVLVLMTSLMSHLAQRFDARDIAVGRSGLQAPDPGIVAAISAAIHQHRRNRH